MVKSISLSVSVQAVGAVSCRWPVRWGYNNRTGPCLGAERATELGRGLACGWRCLGGLGWACARGPARAASLSGPGSGDAWLDRVHPAQAGQRGEGVRAARPRWAERRGVGWALFLFSISFSFLFFLLFRFKFLFKCVLHKITQQYKKVYALTWCNNQNSFKVFVFSWYGT
jgi:hypothetical protein